MVRVLTVVSGLPRSGTSMAMAMLHAGGMEVLCDGRRAADEHNPNGYFEYEPVRRLERDASWLHAAGDVAVKIVSPLLHAIPDGLSHRLVLLRRPLAEVVASQDRMMDGQPRPERDGEAVARLLRDHFESVLALLRRRAVPLLHLGYDDVLAAPYTSAQRLAAFVGRPFDVAARASVIDTRLHRVRAGSAPTPRRPAGARGA